MRAFLLALSFVALFAVSAQAAETGAEPSLDELSKGTPESAKPAPVKPQGTQKIVDVHGIITSAKQGSPVAQYQLGLLLLSGQGVKQNRQLAASWFDRAANQGIVDAQWELSKLILDKTVAGGNTAAYKWLLLSAGNKPERIELRDQIEGVLPKELVPIIKRQAASWKPKAEKLEITAPPTRGYQIR
jgi:TPR repeat protein